MTPQSVLRYLHRLTTGDSQAWRYLPYQLKLKFHRIDLGWQSPRDSGLSEERCHWHSNSGGPDLDDLLRTIPISASDSLLDIGCGKGGAMLTLAKYPFRRVDGVEIAPNLARIATQNLKRLRIAKAEVFCRDAAEFDDLDSYNFFYMYNPFPAAVMRRVVENMRASIERSPRKVIVIYKNPVFAECLGQFGFTKLRETRQQHPDYPPFSIYLGAPFSTGMQRPA